MSRNICVWISSEWSYKLFFSPQQTHGKIFFSVVRLAWKLARAAYFPGSDSSALTAWVRSLKGSWNLHVTQSYVPSMKQSSAGVTLVCMGIAGGCLGGLVFQENYEMQQRSNLGLLRVMFLPLGSLPCASLNGLCPGGKSRYVWYNHEKGPGSPLQPVLSISSSWMPWNWAAGDGKQIALGTECGCNKQRRKYGCRISVVSGRTLPLLGKTKEKSIGGPWKSVVKPNIQHPSGDFHAIIFIGKNTEAIGWAAWKMVWCLERDGEEADVIHPPLLETESFTSASMTKGRAPAAVLWLREEECFPVSSARLLSHSICETWKWL